LSAAQSANRPVEKAIEIVLIFRMKARNIDEEYLRFSIKSNRPDSNSCLYVLGPLKRIYRTKTSSIY
jgi:hypothetical protein